MGTGDAQRTIRIFSLFSPLREPKKMEWVSLVFALSIRTRVLWPAKEKLHKERTKRAKKPANRHVSIAAILKEKKEGRRLTLMHVEFENSIPGSLVQSTNALILPVFLFYFFLFLFFLFHSLFVLFCFDKSFL